MNRRRLLSALVAAALAVFLWIVYQRKFETEVSGGDKIKVLIATRPIEPGRPINDDALGVREVPQAYIEDRAIKDVERAKVLGLRTSVGLQPQQTLMWTDVVTTTDDKQALGTKVPPGSRAVSIKTSVDDATTAMIRPGDYVDLIGVLGQQVGPSDTRSSVVLLQRVLILATGLRTSGASQAEEVNGKPATYSEYDTMLTLALTLPEAQVLQLTAEKGRITVALRNPEDPRIMDKPADISASVLLEPNQRENIRGVRRGGLARLEEKR